MLAFCKVLRLQLTGKSTPAHNLVCRILHILFKARTLWTKHDILVHSRRTCTGLKLHGVNLEWGLCLFLLDGQHIGAGQPRNEKGASKVNFVVFKGS